MFILLKDKNLKSFIGLLLIQKKCIQKIIFLKKVCLEVGFPNRVKFKGKWKVRVPSHASVSKYYADKTYVNLWFILLQVTKGFRFQKNKTVRFISGNFSSDRFS